MPRRAPGRHSPGSVVDTESLLPFGRAIEPKLATFWGEMREVGSPRAIVPVQALGRDEAVLKALAGFVRQETLRPGQRLPTERILAERLKVSRNTVREALTRWEGLGLVERRQGSGTYLKGRGLARHAAHAADAARRRRFHRPDADAGDTARARGRSRGAVRRSRRRRRTIAGIRAQAGHRWSEVFHETTPACRPKRTGSSTSPSTAPSGNPLFEQIIAAMHELFHRFWEHPLGVRDFGHASFPFHRTMFERIAARDAPTARAPKR